MGNLHTSDDTVNEAAIFWISPACLQRKRRTTVTLVYSSLQDLSHMLEQPDGGQRSACCDDTDLPKGLRFNLNLNL